MASKRRVRNKECRSKVRHATEAEAHTAIRLGGQRFRNCHAYPCPWCSGWHLGHRKGYFAADKAKHHVQRQLQAAA